jgi:3-deoxy-D-manno-octulosonic-acid transferase
MRQIYNLLFNIGLLFAAPYYFLRMVRRGNWAGGFGERFGRYNAPLKQALTNRDVVWLHAVSVGEVNLCVQLIRALEPLIPNYKLVVSTTTSTGMAELQRSLPSHISKIYYPIDRRKYVQRAMAVIHPEAVVLIEAEIWPNFLWALQRRNIPHFLVNARISPRSFRRYKWASSLFQPLFAGFDGVGAQSQADADRLIALGCRSESVEVIGSLKFGSAKVEERRVLDVDGLLKQLGVSKSHLIWVCGSTHAGEEIILARTYQKLKSQFPNLFLVIVPRHQERGREVGQVLDDASVRFVYRKEMTRSMQFNPGDLECLLVNTTGELRAFYERADVVFVGKSLTASGGQNPIEPAAFGKPVVFGPNMENFPQVVPQFLTSGGAVQVEDEMGLMKAMIELLNDPERRQRMGVRAREVVHANRGGIERTAELIATGLTN